MKVFINRIMENKKETLGVLSIYNDFERVFECKTLELPWLNNEQNISCIPSGTYTVKVRYSDKHGMHFHIQDVKGRTWILIHAGNFHSDIKGCIVVGNRFIDINGDGFLDVANSKKTMQELRMRLPEEFLLHIA